MTPAQIATKIIEYLKGKAGTDLSYFHIDHSDGDVVYLSFKEDRTIKFQLEKTSSSLHFEQIKPINDKTVHNKFGEIFHIEGDDIMILCGRTTRGIKINEELKKEYPNDIVAKVNQKEEDKLVKELLDYYHLRYLLREKYKEDNGGQTQEEEKNNSSNKLLQNNMKQPLNTILYGPPGTGKTYNTVNKALEIIYGDKLQEIKSEELKKEEYAKVEEDKKERKAYQNLFNELKGKGQIVFTTFHQNYTYEDFMIGIKPNVEGSSNGLSFKPHEGIFYKIAKEARGDYENSLKDEQTISRENWVKEKFEEFINSIRDTLENGSDHLIGKKFPDRKVLSIEDDIYYQQGGEKGVARHMDFNDIIYAYLDNTFENKDIQNNNRLTRTARNTGLTQYYVDILKQFKDFAGEYKKQNDAEKESNTKRKNFVLIIDEINRANISKVFGELITLLEDDKRLGAENELKVTLPNGEEFSVPPNLYVIGTMNTADKSIALIDIALRRRFHFEGKYPKPDFITDKYEDAETKIKFLKAINDAIYKKKNSADWLIGHAYFMKNESLDTIIRNKIIPLLMEYFGNKTDEVKTILSKTNSPYTFNPENFDWEKGEKLEMNGDEAA